MKRIILAALCGLLVTGTGLVQAEEGMTKGSPKILSAWDGLMIFQRGDGFVDMGGWRLDVSEMSIPEKLQTYWKNMKIREVRQGRDEESNLAYYFFVLEPLDFKNKFKMPATMEFIFQLFGPNGGSSEPTYKIGKLIEVSDGQHEFKQAPAPTRQKNLFEGGISI